MKFYQTNDLFNNDRFATVCNNNGIPAYAIDGGVMVDVDAYLAKKLWELPHWLYCNRRFIARLAE